MGSRWFGVLLALVAASPLASGCKDDGDLPAPGAECLATRDGYPGENQGCSTGSVIPNFKFLRAVEGGATELSLGDYYQQRELLVWLAATGWCGACRYAARNLDPLAGDNVYVLATLAENEDGDVAQVEDAVAWKDGLELRYEVAADSCGAGGTDNFGACGASLAALPTVFVIDLRTMQILYRDSTDRYVPDVVDRALAARGL